ncbi:hypothetical protein AO062_25150 [Variovorax boronicumulans]|nr:hypothetical protein AO062_25150 [Variovorax boronicumulans]
MPSRHQQADAGQVARRQMHHLGRVLGAAFEPGLGVLRVAEILELQRFGQVGLQRLEDAASGAAFEDGAQHVGVPVVVVPELARRMAAPGRSLGLGLGGLVGGRMVDTRAQLQQLPHGGRAFGVAEPVLVADAELAQRLVQVDLAAADVNAVEHALHALAHRGQVHRLVDVAVGMHEHALVDHEVGVGLDRCGKRVGHLELRFGPVARFSRARGGPLRGGEHAGRGHGVRGAQQQHGRQRGAQHAGQETARKTGHGHLDS